MEEHEFNKEIGENLEEMVASEIAIMLTRGICDHLILSPVSEKVYEDKKVYPYKQAPLKIAE